MARTQEEIKSQIERLREMKPNVKRSSFFGDDHHAAIEAQVQVLEKLMDEDDIYERWPEDGDTYERNCALDALSWMDGKPIEDAEDPNCDLTDLWKELLI